MYGWTRKNWQSLNILENSTAWNLYFDVSTFLRTTSSDSQFVANIVLYICRFLFYEIFMNDRIKSGCVFLNLACKLNHNTFV